MIFSQLKVYAWGFVGVLLAGLGVAVKVLTKRNSNLSRKVKTGEARIQHAKAVILSDKVADEQEDVHLAEVAKEVEEGKVPDELKNHNTW